jgi:Tfp pilus assembly protein FimT
MGCGAIKISFWMRKENWGIGNFMRKNGFSLIEVCVCLGLVCSMSAFALVQTRAALPGMRASGAMNLVTAQLRNGRQAAIAQRRNIQVQFIGNNQIRLVRNDPNSGTTVLNASILEYGCQFIKFAEITADTPDTLGMDTALCFGSATLLTFRSDGTLVDQNLIPVNGTISIGLPGYPRAARAVTVVGATGRVRGYRWNGSQWRE